MNKKLLLGIITIFLSTLAINAQQSRYGFRLGLNYSDIDFEDGSTGIDVGNSDARIGFTAGFFAQYYLSEKFSIQPELQYSAQGERSTVRNDREDPTNGSDRLGINVLQLPVLLNFHIGKLSLSAGPQVGLRIWEWERQNDYEAFHFSGVAGITYDITDNFQATLRGSYGLTDAIETNEESSFNAIGVNHYLQFTVAYRL